MARNTSSMDLENDYQCTHHYILPYDDYCQACEQCSHITEIQGRIKRRSNRTKCQLHPCPSCQCQSDTMEYSPAVSKSDNINIVDMLKKHEKKVMAGLNYRSLSPTSRQCSRKRHSAVPHKPRGCRSDALASTVPLSPMLENYADSGSPEEDLSDNNRQAELFKPFPKNRSRTSKQCHNKRVPYDRETKGTNVHDATENHRVARKDTTKVAKSTLQNCPSDEFTNKEACGDAYCEIIVENEDEKLRNIKKCVYAGGDLDVHSMKNHILSLVDRALSDDFSCDQYKNHKTKKPMAQQEIRIEITRVLQAPKCQTPPEPNPSNKEASSSEKHLKDMFRERLNHIENQIEALYKLENLNLHSESPSLPCTQPLSHSVKSDSENRQQQGHEKHPRAISTS